MRKTIDATPARGVLVALIGALLLFAGPAVADAKGQPRATGVEIGLIAPGTGYGSPHGSMRVRTVQHLLRRTGERPGPVDGRFGPLTQAAVERFQERQGLAVDGVVGPVTAPALRRAASLIAPETGYGSPHGSTRVRTVQHLLRRTGERPGPVDGRFGPLTQAAVERFQERQGLAVDGVVGKTTKGRLERLVALSSERPGAHPGRAEGRKAKPEPGRTTAPKAAGQAGPRPAEKTRPKSSPGHSKHDLPLWLIAVMAGAMLLAAALALARRAGRRPTEDGQAVDAPQFQVRIHGRRGRGVMTAAELLSVAALVEGRDALAFPSLRSGAVGPQVVAFCRIGGRSIRPREPISRPDGLIVEDPGLLHLNGRLKGLGPAGYLLINSTKSIEELGLGALTAWLRDERHLTIPATELARQHLGLPIPDTALVGGFVALSGVVSMTSVVSSIRERFRGPNGDASVAAALAAFEYVEHQLRGPPTRKQLGRVSALGHADSGRG